MESSSGIWDPTTIKEMREIKKQRRLDAFMAGFNQALADATWDDKNESAVLHSLVSAIVSFRSPTEEELDLVRKSGYYDIKLHKGPCCGSIGACFDVTIKK